MDKLTFILYNEFFLNINLFNLLAFIFFINFIKIIIWLFKIEYNEFYIQFCM